MKKMMMQVLSVLLCVALLVPPMAPRAKAAVTPETVASFFGGVSFYYGLAEDVLLLAGAVLGINYDQLSTPTDIEGTVWETGTGWMGDSNRYVEIESGALMDFVRDLGNEFRGTDLSFYPHIVSGYGKSYRVVACDGVKNGHRYTYIFTIDGIVLCSPVEEEPLSDIWIPLEDIGTRFVMLSYPDFYNKVAENAGAGCTPEDHIVYPYGNDKGKKIIAHSYPDRDRVLARSDGSVYATPYDPSMLGINQDRPSTEVKDENGNEITIEPGANVGIDMENGTITLEDGSVLEMIQNTYDESTKTYYVDARTYIDEGDTYIYNTYQYTYHINYTSITYIGQTEEYNKYYEVYYELPDGRSSADLTAEDLEQLNVSVDVIPYGRSADDTSLRSLYHFDGDTQDSSYWNYCTDFTWNKGASLTYMDAGVFNGALYLDETEHDFTITLPSAIGTGDFTLQFRYYQSHTEAPVTDSWFGIDGSPLVYFDGAHLCFSSSDILCDMPIGTWNEIALVREDSKFTYYLNGLPLRSGTLTTAIANQFQFHFGSQQQTFKYFDELRILNKAIVPNGQSYEPTSVPHDTNLTLVLPDSQMPVADEYWDFDTTITPIKTWDFTGFNGLSYQYYTDNGSDSVEQDVELFSSTDYTKATQYDGFTLVEGKNSTWDIPTICSTYRDRLGFFTSYRYKAGMSAVLFYPYSGTSGSQHRFYMVGKGFSYNAPGWQLSDIQGKSYTFSIVLSDGSLNSLTFKIPNSASNYAKVAKATFDWGQLALTTGYSGFSENYLPYMITILPDAGKSVEIVYAELVSGSTPNTGHEFVGSITGIDRADLNTPTLAVRTDRNITSYQIGGPRPSVPTKGLVWALVENDRITSIQIYNGSAWEGVDGRIWTGERWIPASSFNIITLQDMYDIVDATHDFEYIYTESGFWAWWQRSWNDFTKMIDDRLKAILKALGGSGTPEEIKPGADGKSKFTFKQFFDRIFSSDREADSSDLETVFDNLLDLAESFVVNVKDFFAGFVVMDGLSSDYFEGVSDTLGSVSGLVSGSWEAVPEDIQDGVIAAFMLTVFGVLISVI